MADLIPIRSLFQSIRHGLEIFDAVAIRGCDDKEHFRTVNRNNCPVPKKWVIFMFSTIE